MVSGIYVYVFINVYVYMHMCMHSCGSHESSLVAVLLAFRDRVTNWMFNSPVWIGKRAGVLQRSECFSLSPQCWCATMADFLHRCWDQNSCSHGECQAGTEPSLQFLRSIFLLSLMLFGFLLGCTHSFSGETSYPHPMPSSFLANDGV